MLGGEQCGEGRSKGAAWRGSVEAADHVTQIRIKTGGRKETKWERLGCGLKVKPAGLGGLVESVGC